MHDQSARSEHPLAPSAMHASLKSIAKWPPSRENASRFTLALCAASTLGNLLIYSLSAHLPPGLLVLNIAALGCVWMQYHLSRKSIKFQPQELADRLLQVQENERHRLSRELHDDIGQLLTAAKLQSDWLRRRMPEELQGQCSVLCDTLDETLTKVRDVSAILNPRQLTSLGLEASLRAHLLKTLTNTSVHWSLECHQRLTGIPEEMAVAAFRITQEAITNILRHAEAKNLLVCLQRLPQGLSLLISDDGLGFAPATDPGREGQRGMAGMSERIAQLGGTLTVTSEPGKGTQIEALLPWAPRALERASTKKVIH
ncbi:Histidine kinase-, DNA gyrase B-, and HSP90-like ATPase [Pseudomonas mohnii]|uniref:histidine kinase n=2 Tax=Pseudomonas TaxID=286 RepID=A0ABY0YDF8_9PSED|nr:Histidine kinase-, DNA gyrase B-, and HSP90-like ATPase [Pseudomonas mohnii]